MIKNLDGKRILLILIAALLATLILLAARGGGVSQVGAEAPAQAAVPQDPALIDAGLPIDQLMIQFVERADPANMPAEARLKLYEQLSETAGVQLELVRPMSGDAYVMRVPQRMRPSQVLAITEELQTLPGVVYAEPDLIKQIAGEPLQGIRPNAPHLVPNDPMYPNQWHYRYVAGTEEGVNLVPAWDITTGNPGTNIAILDTGTLVNHPDLSGKLVAGYDFISNTFVANDGDGRDPNPADPGDWVVADECEPGSQPDSSSWHGSHVAGTVAAATNNGTGVAGINWQGKIQTIRVLGRCGGSTSDIIDGSRWAAGLAVPGVPANANPSKVLNLSLGGPGACSVGEQNAFDAVVAAGATVVIAAGNESVDAADSSPGNCNNVITVASNDKFGNRAFYSNFGSSVEITAPGGDTTTLNEGVLSTVSDSTTDPASGSYTYQYFQGTSMASPHVAGVVSLLYGQNPALTPAQILTTIQNTARDFPGGSNCDNTICGSGIIDAFQALQAISPAATPTATTVGATPTATATPGTDACMVYPSTDVPMTIPDSGDLNSVSSVVNVPTTGMITDVDVVGLQGTHSWFADLDFNLTSPQATEVEIMGLSCEDGEQYENFDLNLDDAAAGTWPCPPVGGGTYQPTNPLAAFNGQQSGGMWTLRIDDNVDEDGGSLDNWGLRICTQAAQPTSTPTSTPTVTSTPNPNLTHKLYLPAVFKP